MQWTPWLNRNFSFDFPVTDFPFIAERLRCTGPRILELVKGKSPDLLSVKPGGSWSIKEHIGHLSDLEELHRARLNDFRSHMSVLRKADMSNEKTRIANHNSKPVEELLEEFGKTRVAFLLALEGFGREGLEQSALHPRLNKQMRVVDLAYFVAEHDNHHLVLMHEILKKAL